jgi:hypothetical protein
MATQLEQQIMQALQTTNAEDLPVTVVDLARRCQAEAQMVVRTARHLIDAGQAKAAIVLVHGVPTMYGLVPDRQPDLTVRRAD